MVKETALLLELNAKVPLTSNAASESWSNLGRADSCISNDQLNSICNGTSTLSIVPTPGFYLK